MLALRTNVRPDGPVVIWKLWEGDKTMRDGAREKGRGSLTKSIAFLLVILLVFPFMQPTSSLPIVNAAGLSVGDTVEVQNAWALGLAVRGVPAGSIITRIFDGTRGVIVEGPRSAAIEGITYTWWRINWPTTTGWSAEGLPGGVRWLREVAPPPPATALSFTSLSPTTFDTATAPFNATLTAAGSNFNNIADITFVWHGAVNGNRTWFRGDHRWNAGVAIHSDTSMTLIPNVVEPGAAWSGRVDWSVTLRDNQGRTATRSFVVNYAPPLHPPSRMNITIVSPNGGELWGSWPAEGGERQVIRWTSSGLTGNVNIELSLDGGTTWVSLFLNTPNDGNEVWRVTESPRASARARIRVSNATDSAIFDTSNGNFVIVGPLYKGFPRGYCTWYAAIEFDRVASRPGVNWHGNAQNWYQNASDAGWTATRNSAEVIPGSIIVWGGGGFGHVAIVREVTSSHIRISEMNSGTLIHPGITTRFGEVTIEMLPRNNLNRHGLTFLGFILPRQAQQAVLPPQTSTPAPPPAPTPAPIPTPPVRTPTPDATRPTTGDTAISVWIDDRPLSMDVQPFIKNNRVMVPVRAISEALRAHVGWDNNTQTAILTLGGTSVRLNAGNTVAFVNDLRIILNAPVVKMAGRLFVPLRFVETFGKIVDWIEERRQVVIKHPQPPPVEIIPSSPHQEDKDETHGRIITQEIISRTNWAKQQWSAETVDAMLNRWINRNKSQNMINLIKKDPNIEGRLSRNVMYVLNNPFKWTSIQNGFEKTGDPFRGIIIHHTASSPPSGNRNWENIVQNIWEEHVFFEEWVWNNNQRYGWGDIAYHFLIDPDGTIYEGRKAFARDNTGQIKVRYGAHSGIRSEGRVGIAFLGNFNYVKPTEKALEAAINLMGEIFVKFSISVDQINQKIEPHWPDLRACPGENLHNKLPHIREQVREIISR